MTAKQTAFSDMTAEIKRIENEDLGRRFMYTKGKNPNWDVWTVKKYHILNWKKYNFGLTIQP